MPDRGKLGAGRDARFHMFERSGTLHGARFVLRRTPADAVASAVEYLVAEGFIERDDNLDARLEEIGSPWLARAVEIGDAKGSWAKGLFADLIEDTPLILLNRLSRGISPTLVMVAARSLPEAATELVIYPHPSGRGDPEGWAGAAKRVRTTIATMEAAAVADGTLISHEKMLGIRNDGSPASQQMVEDLLGWR